MNFVVTHILTYKAYEMKELKKTKELKENTRPELWCCKYFINIY